MDDTHRLLRELVALQQASIRLQKLAISLQAEALTYLAHAATGGKSAPAVERRVLLAVKQIRATAERVERGRKLPR